jgi:WD40 repeat protein
MISAAAPSPARVGVREQRGPYQGLAPYAEEDAPFFFGRDGERDIVIANLLASRLTVVYGTSGVGKTSLLRAGVAHRLRERGKDRLARGGRPELLVVVFDAWRDDPVAGIEAAIRAAAAGLFGAGVELGSASGRLAERLRRWTGELSCDLLVILDQTEEYFLYHAGEDGEGTFAVEFPRAVNAPDLAVNFLLSIREDALSRLDRFKSRVPGLLANLLRVQHLDLHAARSAIQDPLDEYNRRLPGGQPWSIEPELVELVLDELRPGQVVLGATGQGAVDEAGGRDQHDRRVETPFLQLVMTQLWTTEAAAGSHVLRAATLGRLGGAKEIVRSHLDQAMRALGPDEQDVAAGIFHYLVSPSGSKVAFTAADLAGWAELPEARIEPLLERLSLGDTRVVRPVGPAPGGSGGTRYEVFHDVLAPAVLEWRAKHVAAQAAEEAAQVAEERLHQARRKTRRLTGFVIALGALLLVAVASTALAVYQGNRADAQRRRAVSFSMVAQADARATDQPDLSMLLSLAAYELQPSDEARASALLQADRRRDAGALLTGAAGVLSGAAFSPDGRLFAAGDTRGFRLWQVTSRRQPALLAGGGGRVHGVAFSPDGRLVVASSDNGVEVWQVASRRQLALLAEGGGVRGVAFSPDGDLLAAGYKDGVRIWDVPARRRVALLARRGGADYVAFGEGGRTLASASGDEAGIALWDVPGRRMRRTLQGHPDGVSAIAISSDGRTLVSASVADSNMLVWDLASGRSRVLTDEHGAGTVAFSPDGHTVATVGDDDSTVEVWSVDQRIRLRGLTGNVGQVTTVVFSPDGRTLASCGSDRTVALFEVPQQPPVGNNGPVNALAFSKDGGTVATAGADGQVALWDARTRAPRAVLRGHHEEVTSVAFTPDGRILASAALDGETLLWDAKRGRPLRVPGFDAKDVYKLAFSPSGNVLALAGLHGSVTLWDTLRWARLAVLHGHKGQVNSVAFDPAGRRLASGGKDGRVVVWDVQSHARLADLAAHSDAVNRVAFSPDGRSMASAGDDNVVILWDLPGRTPTAIFPGQNVAFSPDGRTLAVLQPSSGLTGGRIVLWDVARRVPTGLLTSGTGLTFSPDGQVLATVGDDLVLHDLDPASWRRQLCALAGRDLTGDEWNLFAPGVHKRAICP